jgi:hypothetical protein
MNRALVRAGVIFVSSSLLQSCGGGDGDGDGGGGNNPPPPDPPGASLSVSSENIAVEATPGEESPSQELTITIEGGNASNLFVDASSSINGVSSVHLAEVSASQRRLVVQFRSPGSLENDTYRDSITVRACEDVQCSSQIDGSPASVSVAYEVSGTGISTVTVDRDEVQFDTDTAVILPHTETVRLNVEPRPASGFVVQLSYSFNGIQHVTQETVSNTAADVQIKFKPAWQVRGGHFEDDVHIDVCYDSSCVRRVAGAPLEVATAMDVEDVGDPEASALAVESRETLGHDVIDAEFSTQLDSIVMVGSHPVNALYVYNVRTGEERRQLLNKIPNCVSVAPDGLTAAVGHDALITVVELETVEEPGAPDPALLDVSTDVLDIVLDGNGNAHAFPRVDQWQNIHSVDIATNTETLSGGILYAGTLGRLHPGGRYVYSADNGLSPSDIAKWDLQSGVAVSLSDSPYHGDFAMCGDLWFSENGATIFTRCGNTFRATEVPGQDMTYTGALQLSDAINWGFMIKSLSHDAPMRQIALLEDECHLFTLGDPCHSRLAFYESDFFNRVARFIVPPVTVAALQYEQRGMFVFHDRNNGKKYMIGQLQAMPNPDAEYHLSVLP